MYQLYKTNLPPEHYACQFLSEIQHKLCNKLCVLSIYVFRGHTVRAVTESFQMAKDAGFKVVAHMMPDLPNVGLERDVEQFIASILQIVMESLLSMVYLLYWWLDMCCFSDQ